MPFNENQATMQNDPELAAAASMVTPTSQVQTGSAFEDGQYDWKIEEAIHTKSDKGLYIILLKSRALAPAELAKLPGNFSLFTRTLYIGTNKDPMALLPETRKSSPSIGFLVKIAKVNEVSTNDQALTQLTSNLLGKQFGCALVKGKPYVKDGVEREGGLEFGRTVTPVGTLPAKLNRVAAQANGQAGAPAAPVGVFS